MGIVERMKNSRLYIVAGKFSDFCRQKNYLMCDYEIYSYGTSAQHRFFSLPQKSGGTYPYGTLHFYIVDRAKYLIAVYDDEQTVHSGIMQTVNYAKKKEIIIIFIQTDRGEVVIIMFYDMKCEKVCRKAV